VLNSVEIMNFISSGIHFVKVRLSGNLHVGANILQEMP
jgi:hypothetical protein